MFDSISVSRFTLLPSRRVGSSDRRTTPWTSPRPRATARAKWSSKLTRRAMYPGVLMFETLSAITRWRRLSASSALRMPTSVTESNMVFPHP